MREDRRDDAASVTDDIRYETVELDGRSPFLLPDFEIDDPQRSVSLKAKLYRPATTPGPYPAVVVSEGLGGLKVSRETRYGRLLAQNGCAALVVDSFGTRGWRGVPDAVRALAVTESMMLADAFTALVWLARQPDILADRITNVGFSYGGMIAILTAYEQLRRHFVKGSQRFAGHISYYGSTVPRMDDPRTTGAPVVMMVGDRDENVDLDRFHAIADDLRRGGSAVEAIVFPGAFHQWDSDDIEPRFDPLNIRNCRVRIGRNCEITDENTGQPVRGFASRAMMMTRAVSLRGFSLKRDDATLRRSDQILLRMVRGAEDRALRAAS